MCGFENNKLSVALDGKSIVRPYKAILTWDDMRMRKPGEVYLPNKNPNDAQKENETFQRGEYAALMKRRAILAQIWRDYPQAHKAIGQADRHKGPNYKKLEGWSDGSIGTSCTLTNPRIVKNALGNLDQPAGYDIAYAPDYMGPDPDDPEPDVNKKRKKKFKGSKDHPAFVYADEGKLPSVGDTYLLTNRNAIGAFLHVGTILHVDVSADGAYWITGDGGQRDPYAQGQAAHLVRRQYRCISEIAGKPKVPHLSGGAEGDRRLHGWLDIGHPSVVAKRDLGADDKLDEDYRNCGAWIDRAKGGP
jgi:hypothetical protein